MASKKKLPLRKQSTTETRFTSRFIASLFKMRGDNNHKTLGSAFSSSSSDEEIRRRSHNIKIAAYSSMARAVGSKRFWSRALLLKLRNRRGLHGILRNNCLVLKKKKRVIIKSKDSTETSKIDMLRKLVPGGKSMDFCGLLEETAHYMKCLTTQVKVMQSIVNQYSE